MPIEAISGWVFASVLLALRIGPALAFAPPFTLTRTPAIFRVVLALGLAACMVGGNPQAAALGSISLGGLVFAALRELMLGGLIAMAFQVTFGALYFAGRTIDVQAGYGLAMLIDPTTRTQTPLIGTVFAYLAGAVFFAIDGHADLLRLVAASLRAIPLGGWDAAGGIEPVVRFISIAFVTGLGVGGGVVLALLVTDMAIAMMSRTVPQMNVLLLGFQVKVFVLLLILPMTLGVAAALLTRLMVFTLESIPGMM
jgi:flagellar biosynthetic protein FliR